MVSFHATARLRRGWFCVSQMSTRRPSWCHIRAIRAFTFEDKKWLLPCLEDNIGQIRGSFCPKIHSCGKFLQVNPLQDVNGNGPLGIEEDQ